MKIIPVLDIKGGKVVRAEGGRRELYRPIVTPLSADPDPVSVVRGMRRLHPFETFYIADLDAIEGNAPNGDVPARLANMSALPELWLDAGFTDRKALENALAQPHVRPVVGSESQVDEMLVRDFRSHPGLILSLDFFADGFHGPERLLSKPSLWPATVIVMTLARVGSGSGPDLERLRDVMSKAENRTVIAAGGIRNANDLHELDALGIGGALMASALHDGALTSVQLAQFDRAGAR